MHYIPEDQMAFDASKLGFPSVYGCQAICVHSSRGLYGFHDLKTGSKLHMTATQAGDAKLSVFGAWVLRQMQSSENLIAVYGVINRGQQYSADTTGNAEWSAVLTSLSQAMNFTGNVYGARIDSHVSKKDSAYIEYSLAGNYVTVGFKRWSKMESDHNHPVQPQLQGRVKFDSKTQTFDPLPLFGKGLVSPALRKDGKNLNLNLIATKKFIQFQ